MKKNMDYTQISVVVQGKVASDSYPDTDIGWTKKLFQQLRNLLPGATLILSTWSGENVDGIDFDLCVFSRDPGACLYDEILAVSNNTNRQIVSTKSGLDKVNTLYSLKLRTDSMINSLSFIDYFGRYQRRQKDYNFFSNHIISCATYAKHFVGPKKYQVKQIFQISDLVFFGFTQDLLALFNAPLQQEPEASFYFKKWPKISEDAYPTMTARFTPEQYLWWSFLLRHMDIQCDNRLDFDDKLLQISHESIMSNFVFLDQNHWGLEVKGHTKQAKLSPWVWDGLYHHAYWKKEYAKMFGLTQIHLPTVMQLQRVFYSYSWLPPILIGKSKSFCRRVISVVNRTKLRGLYKKSVSSNLGIHFSSWLKKKFTRFPQDKKNIQNILIPQKLNSVKDVIPFLEHYDYISVDIFDTLISRSIHPIWVPMAQTGFIAEMLFKNEDIEINQDIFNQKRDKVIAEIYAENQKKYFDSEYQIREVFKRILVDFSSDKEKIDHWADLLAENERERELKTLFLKPGVMTFLEACRDAGKKVVAISDMYFSKEDIIYILEKIGILSFFEQIFVSSEYTLTKHTGSLFPQVVDELGVSKKSILHLGDNTHSDVMSARRRGIDSIWIYDAKDHACREVVGQYYIGERSFSPFIASVLKSQVGSSKSDKFIQLIKDHLAPDLCNFTYDTLLNARMEGVSSIFFLERDGTLFYELAHLLDEKIAFFFNLKPINLKKIKISRRRSACLDDVGTVEEFIHRAVRGGVSLEQFSILKLLAAFAIDINDFPDDFQKELTEKDSSRFWLYQVYLDNILPVVIEKRRNLLKELGSEGFFDGEKVAVCDVGWAGTIQKDLASGMILEGYDNRLYGYYYGSDDRMLDLDSFSPTSCYKAGYIKGEYILGAYSAVEFFIKDYCSKRNESVLQLGETTIQLNEVSRKTIIEYASEFANIVNEWGILPNQIAEVTKKKAVSFFRRPPRELLPLLDEVKFSLDRKDGDEAIHLVPKIRLFNIVHDIRMVNEISQWKQGAWRRGMGKYVDWLR